jgi:hypothetical protein
LLNNPIIPELDTLRDNRGFVTAAIAASLVLHFALVWFVLQQKVEGAAASAQAEAVCGAETGCGPAAARAETGGAACDSGAGVSSKTGDSAFCETAAAGDAFWRCDGG